jgi:trigger factor
MDATVARHMATSGVTTTVTELPESRVRVQAEVAPEEIERKVAQSARSLGRSLRVPGFRNGKVPPPIVIQRVGREAVLDEAVRDNLSTWYTAAIDDAHIAPIGDPDLDLGDLPGEGQPLTFSIEIGVRPKATLGEYKGLEVGRADATVGDDLVDAEVEQLRERSGRLDTVERAAQKGDFVVMDFVGSIDGTPFPGGEGRDQMIELGSGRLIPGFEEQLEGASAGDDVTVSLEFPDDYGAEELAGKSAEFAVSVKEVKSKQLPEVDEDFAVEQGFDTVEELREDIRERLSGSEAQRIEAQYREAVLDSVVRNATVELPDALVEARAKELWDQMAHSLSHQGIDRQTYLKLAGKSEEEILDEAKPDAEVQLRREAVLAAIVAAESIDPSDEELLEALSGDAERSRTSPKKLLERIKSAGRVDALKEDVAHAKAIDAVVDAAKPVSVEDAKARDLLHTPEPDDDAEAASASA